jgi:hypothetical protein
MESSSRSLKISNWSESGVDRLTKDSLRKLLNNKIPYIRIQNFASPQECKALITEVECQEFGLYDNVMPPIERIGCTVFESYRNKSEGYFQLGKREAQKRDRIFSSSFNPLDRLISMLAGVSGRDVGIARNQFGEYYYAGLLRKIEQGTELHIDFAPAEQDDWEICDVVNQLAWNLYLQVGASGSGQILIHDRAWEPEDEAYKHGSYGYHMDLVKDCDLVTLNPQKGEVILFNTRNYHLVTPSKGTRVTVASAIGELPDSQLVFWS